MAAIRRGEKNDTEDFGATIHIADERVAPEKSLPIVERPQPTAILSSRILCCSKLRVFRYSKLFSQTLNNY
tara:strand:- start:256 stop:468 length:213 start_codon:yes stop_codon:yes gene_type:complete